MASAKPFSKIKPEIVLSQCFFRKYHKYADLFQTSAVPTRQIISQTY